MLDEKLSSFSNPFYLCPGNFDYIENYNNKILSLRKRKITKLISGYRKKKNNSTITNQNNKVSTAKIEYELSQDQFCLENYTEIKSISSSIEDLEKSLKSSNINDVKWALYSIRKFYQKNDIDDINQISPLFTNNFLDLFYKTIITLNDPIIHHEILWILINIFACSSSDKIDIKYYYELLSEKYIKIYNNFLSSENNEITSSTLWLLSNIIYGKKELCMYILEENTLYKNILSLIKENKEIKVEILVQCAKFISVCMNIQTSDFSRVKYLIENINLSIEKLILMFVSNNSNEIRSFVLTGLIYILKIEDENEISLNDDFARKIITFDFNIVYYILNLEKASNFFYCENLQRNNEDDDTSWFFYISLVVQFLTIIIDNFTVFQVDQILHEGLIDFFIKLYDNQCIFQYDVKVNRKNALFNKITECLVNICQIKEEFAFFIFKSKITNYINQELKSNPSNTNLEKMLYLILYSTNYFSYELSDILYSKGIIKNILEIIKNFQKYTISILNIGLKIIHYYLDSYKKMMIKSKEFYTVKEIFMEILEKIYYSSYFASEDNKKQINYLKNYDY